jgi:mono/diheme cytochrome c family protein
MPLFGGYLNDAQVAAVVDYVRGHFGNFYRDAASADDVKAVRQRTVRRSRNQGTIEIKEQ